MVLPRFLVFIPGFLWWVLITSKGQVISLSFTWHSAAAEYSNYTITIQSCTVTCIVAILCSSCHILFTAAFPCNGYQVLYRGHGNLRGYHAYYYGHLGSGQMLLVKREPEITIQSMSPKILHLHCLHSWEDLEMWIKLSQRGLVDWWESEPRSRLWTWSTLFISPLWSKGMHR